jgi:hypothetical protein
MDYILNHWNDMLAVVGGTVALASLIVKLTPSQADDAILGKIVGVLNHFSVFNPNQPK